ncbi:MAG: hypothetical protein U0270_18000 [Labilithrix sp.]
MRRLVLAAALLAAGSLVPRSSDAAERWVDRPMTLHRLVFAGDAGLGIGHRDLFNHGFTGPGLNLEGAIGVTEQLELGLRTGIRLGDDARITGADSYGRTLWTETYGTGGDTVANPELRIRWVAYSGSIAEVGLDGRVYLPIEDGTRFGLMFGVPLAFHLSDFVRIDTGVYLPTLFYDPTQLAISIPGYFWFQVSEKLWLGPQAAVRFASLGNDGHHNDLLLGFGMGYQVMQAIDLKWWALAPNIDNGLHQWGVGFGAQFRIGE